MYPLRSGIAAPVACVGSPLAEGQCMPPRRAAAACVRRTLAPNPMTSHTALATATEPTPARVIRTYLVISGLFTLSASVIWGVNTLFLLDAGLDIFQVFVVNAAFTVGMVLFEIPTGVVADTSGRRRSFLLSAAMLVVGTLAYVAIAAAGGGVVLFVGRVARARHRLLLLLGRGRGLAGRRARGPPGHDGQLDPVFARGSMVSGAADARRIGRRRPARQHRPRPGPSSSEPGCSGRVRGRPSTPCTTSGSRPARRRSRPARRDATRCSARA